jgi:hypothetical protein
METDVRRESWARSFNSFLFLSRYMDVINVLLALFYLTSAAAAVAGFPSI